MHYGEKNMHPLRRPICGDISNKLAKLGDAIASHLKPPITHSLTHPPTDRDTHSEEKLSKANF